MERNVNDHLSGRYGPSRSVAEPKPHEPNQRSSMSNEGLDYAGIQGLQSVPVSLSNSQPSPESEQPERSAGYVMYPLVPTYGPEYLKTGRIQLMRSASPETNAITYMEQALHQVSLCIFNLSYLLSKMIFIKSIFILYLCFVWLSCNHAIKNETMAT